MTYSRTFIYLLVLSLFSCSKEEKIPERKSLEVTASAYNSLPYQTRKNTSGNITAWGDTLVPGMKSIAISRDLIDSGLTHGTEVKIEGLQGRYTVNDKMNRRWTNKIDIYMGENREKANHWGKQEVEISWIPDQDTSISKD